MKSSNQIKSVQYCTSRHDAASVGMELAPNGKNAVVCPVTLQLRYIVQMYRSCVQGRCVPTLRRCQSQGILSAIGKRLRRGWQGYYCCYDCYLFIAVIISPIVRGIVMPQQFFFAVRTKKVVLLLWRILLKPGRKQAWLCVCFPVMGCWPPTHSRLMMLLSSTTPVWFLFEA